MPAKTAEFIEEVTKELATAEDPVASRQVLGRIRSELTAWEKEVRGSRIFGQFEKARMGDAAATIKAFDRPEFAGDAQYKEWVEDAKRKFGR